MKKTVILLVSTLLAGACSSLAPVYEVKNKAVAVDSSTTLEQAIVTGGSRKGWAMSRVQDGLIKGTLFIRDHEVVVNIPYTEDSYSIRYADSVNMNYSANKKAIHKKYNQWVRNLDLAITRAAQTPKQ